MYLNDDQLKRMFRDDTSEALEARKASHGETIRTHHPDTHKARVAETNCSFIEAELARRSREWKRNAKHANPRTT
jgi:hypothetical protein